jgi:adenylate kinase family enzyme
MKRMLGRQEGRSDDNVNTLKNRILNYNSQTKAVMDVYKKFGKVTVISGEGEIDEVYALTRKAIFP